VIDLKDLTKPGAVVLGVAAAAALGFAAGFIVARDPALLRRLARSAAGSVERVTAAIAESREELADLWAEVREDARDSLEERAFARPHREGAAASATAAANEPEVAPPPSARRGRRRARPVADKTATHKTATH
jgi:hypothetical protein